MCVLQEGGGVGLGEGWPGIALPVSVGSGCSLLCSAGRLGDVLMVNGQWPGDRIYMYMYMFTYVLAACENGSEIRSGCVRTWSRHGLGYTPYTCDL